MSFLWTIGASVLIMLVSLSGVVVVWSGAGRWLQKRLEYITSLAAGVFLVVALQLIRHTINSGESLWYPLLLVAVGVLIAYLLFAYLPLFHHHHSSDCDHEHHYLEVNRILFSDGLHNIGDGLLLAAGFAVSTGAGIAAAVAVFVHEVVQEVSEFFVLKAAGLSTARALAYNFAVSATILLGAVLGHWVITNQALLRLPLLAIAGGSFLVVVVHDFIPHSFQHTKSWRDVGSHLLWFGGGGVVAMAAALLVAVH